MMHGADPYFDQKCALANATSVEAKNFPVLPGGHSEREPPDPIPNSEVKTLCADGSWAASHARVGHCQAPHARRPRCESIGAFFFDPISAINYHGLQPALMRRAQGAFLQTNNHYTRTAVALHWIIALLIIVGFTLAVIMVDLHMSPRK